MNSVLESLRNAPNATALNATLEAAWSNRWLQRCGVDSHLWQPMRLAEVVGWPARFADAKATIAKDAEEDARHKDEDPA